MNIQTVQKQSPYFSGYKIDAKKNKNIEFLYNKAIDVLNTEQQTVIYQTNQITFSKMTKSMEDLFKRFGIKIDKIKD